MLELIGLSSLVINLHSFPSTPIWHQSEIVRELSWQQAKGKPYRSTYERDATGRGRHHDDDLEEIRRRGYERRRGGYEYEDDGYYRSDRYRDEERYRRDRHRREILEERKERIEEQIDILDRLYGY